MKDWIVSIEQKRLKSDVSSRTKSRNKKAGVKTVVRKSSLGSAVDYLLDNKNQNHCNSRIYDLTNAKLVRQNIFDECEEMKEQKGKGVANAASSFVVSIPADLYHPSPEEWDRVGDRTLELFVSAVNTDLEKKGREHVKKDVSKMSERQTKEFHLDTVRFSQKLDIESVKKLTTKVVHDDRDKPLIVGKTAGSHLNLVMSNIHNQEVIKYISQKGGVQAMKNAYNQAIKDELGLDCKKYIAYSNRPDNDKLANYYDGSLCHLDQNNVVKLDQSIPHKNQLKPTGTTQTTELRKAQLIKEKEGYDALKMANEKENKINNKAVALFSDFSEKKEELRTGNKKLDTDILDMEDDKFSFENHKKNENKKIKKGQKQLINAREKIINASENLSNSKNDFIGFQKALNKYSDTARLKNPDHKKWTFPTGQKFASKAKALVFGPEPQEPFLITLQKKLRAFIDTVFEGSDRNEVVKMINRENKTIPKIDKIIVPKKYNDFIKSDKEEVAALKKDTFVAPISKAEETKKEPQKRNSSRLKR